MTTTIVSLRATIVSYFATFVLVNQAKYTIKNMRDGQYTWISTIENATSLGNLSKHAHHLNRLIFKSESICSLSAYAFRKPSSTCATLLDARQHKHSPHAISLDDCYTWQAFSLFEPCLRCTLAKSQIHLPSPSLALDQRRKHGQTDC